MTSIILNKINFDILKYLVLDNNYLLNCMSKNLIIIKLSIKIKIMQLYLENKYFIKATIRHIKNISKNKINIYLFI